jgi:hypothetical protein
VAGFFQAPDPTDEDGAVLATLTENSSMELVDAGRVVHTVTGYGGVLLQGTLRVDPVKAEAFVLPCPVRCDVQVLDRGVTADLTAASASILALVEVAQGSASPLFDLGPWAGLLNPVADGIFLDLPLVANAAEFRIANLTFVRFESFRAALYPGAPASNGSGPLVIQQGTVQGSPEFVGNRYFGMPLWSYFLWGAALVAIVITAVTHAPKHSERWDRLQWIGRVAGAIAWTALALVWHLNFGKVLGVDATSAGLDTNSRLLVGAIEAGTLAAMLLMVVLPARLLASRLFRGAQQGTFMGLAGPLASLVGILAGTQLLLGFVDLALRLVQ